LRLIFGSFHQGKEQEKTARQGITKKARLTAGFFYHSFFENIILFFQQ